MPEVESTVFFPDFHGDLEAARLCILNAGFAEWQSSVLRPLRDTGKEPVFLGDYIDRGRQSLDTIRLVEETRSAVGGKQLIGNHELAALNSLSQPNKAEHAFDWLPYGGLRLLMEVAKEYRLMLRTECDDAIPVPLHELDAELRRKYQEEWKKMVQRDNARYVDFPNAFEKAAELFFHGEFRPFFENLHVAHSSNGVLAAHAGMNADTLKNGLDALTLMYRRAFSEKLFGDLYLRSSRYGPIVHMKTTGNNPLLDAETTRMMKDGEMYAFIRGHQFCRNGIQELLNNAGVAVISSDIGLSNGFDNPGPSRWGFVEHHHKTGEIFAVSDAGGRHSFGRIADGQYYFPDDRVA